MSKTIVSFGEIMLRLTPPDNVTISGAKSFNACYGGSESNVLVALSQLGNKTRYITAVPDNELGDAVVRHLSSYGVETGSIIRRGDNLGMYYLEEGFGVRPSKVVYNRKNSEVSKLGEADFDYDKIFENCGIFHICGISFALSESVRNLCFRLLEEAKKRDITVSFDFNYRSKLWTEEEAKTVFEKVANYVDVMFCSKRDLKIFLDTDAQSFYKKYNSEYLVVRERKVLPSGRHTASAEIYHQTADAMEYAKTADVEFDVLERIGSGDAFAGGVLHALKNDRHDIDGALDFGMTCFVLKHTLKGDVFTLDEKTVKTYLNNLSGDVSR